MACNYDISFKRKFSNTLNSIRKSGITGVAMLPQIFSFLKTVKQDAKNAGFDNIEDFIDNWIPYINNLLEKNGISKQSTIYLRDIILIPETKILDVKENPNTTETLDVTVTTKKEFRKDFLEKIYDGAEYAKNLALNQARFHLCGAMLFDRETGIKTKSEQDLNNNIRDYLQKLFDIVFNYLKTYYTKFNNKNQIKEVDYSVYSSEEINMYKDGVYTGAFDKIFSTASTVFNTFNGRRINLEYKLNSKDLEAFNAFQTLLHFDEILLNFFGDDIKITDMSIRFSNNNKYKFASRATNMAWNNQKDDDIDVSKSVNNVSKFIVESTRLYDWNGNIIPNSYALFGLFINLIGKIKDLSWNLELTRKVELNAVKPNGLAYFNLSNISIESRKFIETLGKDATFATLINSYRFHPIEAISAIFELLTNKDTRNLFKEVLNTFNNVEKRILMSLGIELFNNNGKSLRKIQDLSGYTQGNNYLNYLLQTVDGIWSVKNCQIKTDSETGITEILGLSSSSIKNMLRRLNDNLNNLNRFSTSNTDIKYKAAYDTKVGFTLQMDLLGTGAKLVKLDNKDLLTYDGRAFTANKIPINTMLDFIDEVLHQNLKENPLHLLNYIDIFNKQGNYNDLEKAKRYAIEELFKFSVQVIKGLFVLRLIDTAWNKRTDLSSNKEDFYLDESSKYYGKELYKPKIKFLYGTIDVIPGKMLTVMENLSEAIILTNSGSASTVQTDSEGKALSTSTPSRLLSSFQVLHEQIRNNKNSPANEFMIVSDPSTLVNIYTVREYSAEESKTYNQFNTREFLESSILYDFITPLITDPKEFSKYGLLNNHTIAITPSVNSDKNTISKMIININLAIKKMGYESVLDFIKDHNSSQLIDLINNELKTYYTKLYDKIVLDLAKLSTSPTFQRIIGDNFILEYTPESFREFSNKLKIYNSVLMSPTTIRELISKASSETGVKINEPLHMIFKGDKIMINNSLLALYYRYNDNKIQLDIRKMPDSKKFWKYKAAELTSSLLKNKTFFDVVENKNLYKFLTENGFNEWISSSGTLTIAKINYDYNGTKFTVNATSEIDIENLEKWYKLDGRWLEWIEGNRINATDKLIDNLHLISDDIILNPLLEKYNMLDYLYSQEFILSTVGTHINHPKGGQEEYTTIEGYLEDEANRFLAQHKRNVSFTASMHPFLLDLFDGIPLEYNISVLLDINDYVYTVAGKTETIKPFDGATFVNPFIVLLENNSLNGEHAGIHKKQFVHFYDEELGTGGIIKTAGFGITNSWMRNSPFIERMMKNMTDIQWSHPIDITKKIQNFDYKGEDNNLHIGDFYFSKLDQLGYLRYYKVKNITRNSDGTYTLTVVEVNKKGTELDNSEEIIIKDENNDPVIINSNYKLWKYIFHGLNSVDFNELGTLSAKGKYGEKSIENTVNVINQCGYLQTGYNTPSTQTSYYQPGKHSDIHYGVTEGAIKQGTANFNTKDVYYKNGSYRSFKIKMTQAGILLDKEHHADDSEISMMTLVVSACAALGYTWNEANKMYKALYQLTLLGISPIIKPLALLFNLRTPNALFNFSKVLTGMLVKLLANGSLSKDGLIYNIAYELIEKYRNGQTITDADYINNPVPVSDPMMFTKIQSLLSSILTSSAIKLKFKGILSVLVPSHETIKLYGNKLKGDFYNFDKEIIELQALLKPISVSEIEMGRTYIIRDSNGVFVDKVHIQAPTVKGNEVYGDPDLKYVGYYEMRRLYNTGGYTFTEDITRGRNLSAYYCTFEDEYGEKYNFYDLSSSVIMYSNYANTDVINQERPRLLKQLLALSEGHSVEVTINGVTKLVNPKNINIKPYEVIMPKTMAKLLGLTSEDSLDSLLNDKSVFTKKLINNLSHLITEDNFTVVLKRVNGNHLYVLTKEDFDKHPNKRFLEKTSYPPVIDPTSGDMYAVDEDGNKLYKMSSPNDKIYIVDGKEVVVTDNLNFYLENSSYSTLYVSKGTSDITFDNIFNNNITHKGLQSWKNNIVHNNEGNYDRKNARLRNDMLGNIHYNGETFHYNGIKVEGYMLSSIEQLGQELYASFKKSLDIIAARIPALSMQSFMPMKVVGYEEFDINTAYVSTHQIFLQGSDFDIDAVSLLTFELGNDGKFVGWSPYFNLTSEEHLKLSAEFIYPSGQEVLLILNAKELFNGGSKEEIKHNIKLYLKLLFDAFTPHKVSGKYELTLKDTDDLNVLNALIQSINYVSENGLLDYRNINEGLSVDIAVCFNELYGTNLYTSEMLNLFDSLTTFVNKHNNYIKSNNVEAFTKNYVVELMVRIAKNPVNLIQAQTSVDQTTGEPKALADLFSVAGQALKKATPGNIGNKFLSIEDNHVGKDVIGISAVGLKSFFALTQYANTILKLGNPEAIDRLLNNPIEFNGKTYYTIANVNTTNITNTDILAKLSTLNDKDAALMISALLSLATDLKNIKVISF